jgi:hypothetical protein
MRIEKNSVVKSAAGKANDRDFRGGRGGLAWDAPGSIRAKKTPGNIAEGLVDRAYSTISLPIISSWPLPQKIEQINLNSPVLSATKVTVALPFTSLS